MKLESLAWLAAPAVLFAACTWPDITYQNDSSTAASLSTTTSPTTATAMTTASGKGGNGGNGGASSQSTATVATAGGGNTGSSTGGGGASTGSSSSTQTSGTAGGASTTTTTSVTSSSSLMCPVDADNDQFTTIACPAGGDCDDTDPRTFPDAGFWLAPTMNASPGFDPWDHNCNGSVEHETQALNCMLLGCQTPAPVGYDSADPGCGMQAEVGECKGIACATWTPFSPKQFKTQQCK